MEGEASEERQRRALRRAPAAAAVQAARKAVRQADERCHALQVRRPLASPSARRLPERALSSRYLELNPEDVEILLKTPRSASSASSGSSGGTEAPAEQLKLDPTSWAKWHIEMSEKLKQRKAEAAASLVKCGVPCPRACPAHPSYRSQRVRMYNLDSKKPGTIPKKLPSGSPTPALIPSSASGTVHKEKEKRRESESEASPSPSTDAVAPSPRVSGVGESDVARRSGRGLALKT